MIRTLMKSWIRLSLVGALTLGGFTAVAYADPRDGQSETRQQQGQQFQLDGQHSELGAIREQVRVGQQQDDGSVRVTVQTTVVDTGQTFTRQAQGQRQGNTITAVITQQDGIADRLGGAAAPAEQDEQRYQLQLDGDRCRSRCQGQKGTISRAQGQAVANEQGSGGGSAGGGEGGGGSAGGGEGGGGSARGGEGGGGSTGEDDTPGFWIYTAQAGDTAENLAERFGIDKWRLEAANGLADDLEAVQPGEVLRIPDPLPEDETPDLALGEPTSGAPTAARVESAGGDETFDFETSVLSLSGVADPAIEAKINAAMRDAADEMVAGMRSDLEDWETDPDYPMKSSLWVSADAGILSPELFSVSNSISTYYAGAAHPNHGMSATTYDLTTGEEISTRSMFVEGDDVMARVAAKVDAKLRSMEDYSDEGGEFYLDSPTAEDINTVRVEEDGLRFLFGSYEIGPYAAGLPEAKLTFEELDGLVDASGPLSSLLRR
jgi:LysM repeat protein